MTIDRLQTLVADLAADLIEPVASIEKRTATTQNHYGDYLALIGTLSHDDKRMAQVIALALIKAGANRLGVASALAIYQ